MSWLPIVHVPHARQPRDILEAPPPYGACDVIYDFEEDTQEIKGEDDQEEDHRATDGRGHPYRQHDGAGQCPLNPSEQGGNARV